MSTYFGKNPRLYPENTVNFSNNGLGFLPDGQSCKVTEKLNGGFELEMNYPINGLNYENIRINDVILAPPNPYDEWQPFRIYSISRPQSGVVKVNAEHKSYELSGYPCLPNDEHIEIPGSCAGLMAYLQSETARTAEALGIPAYTFETDITDAVQWSIENPTDIKSVMSLAAQWFGGEWKYDGTRCRLSESRGKERGVKVMYGSNLSTIAQDEVDTSYTHIMPYWTDGTETVYISGYYIIASYTEARMQKRVLVLDLSNEFDEKPTEEELSEAASAWSRENKPKGIEKNLKVRFVARGQTVEYASLGDIDHVELGDTIGVEASPLNISSELKCISLIYDVYRGMYSSAELGAVKSSLATATVTATEKSEFTVWVSIAEPAENFKSGDYWIKINNNVDRAAQALGRYTGGKWLLLCKFSEGGSGTGKFLDDGKTSVAHNDLENNISTCLYDSVDGYKNTVQGKSSIDTDSDNVSNGANTVTGQHNLCQSVTAMFVSGSGNTVKSSRDSVVAGSKNTLNQGIDYSFVGGSNNTTGNGIYCSVIEGSYNNIMGYTSYSSINGSGMTLGGVYKSIAVGGNDTFGYLGNSLVMTGGNCNVTNVNHSLMIGEYFHGTNGTVTDSAIFGISHTINGVATSIVSGHSNTADSCNYSNVSGANNYIYGSRLVVSGNYNRVYGTDSAVFGWHNTVNVTNALVAGMYADSSNGELRLIIGNGNQDAAQNAFSVDMNGNVIAAGSVTPSGADYAEYFEWLDKNPEGEDRCGLLVSLKGDKIVPANGDDIIGIISGRASVVGNAFESCWHGKYMTDVYGRVQTDENGNPMISPEYDEDLKYIPRSQRPEWSPVGMVGRLIVRDNGKCEDSGYVSARNGIAVPTFTRTGIRVLRRVDEQHVEVLIK